MQFQHQLTAVLLDFAARILIWVLQILQIYPQLPECKMNKIKWNWVIKFNDYR